MTAPNRRRPTFRLRTLFVLVTLVSVCCWLGLNYQQVRVRASLYERVRNNTAGTLEHPNATELPMIWRLMGARQIDAFVLEPYASDADVDELRAAFPEAVVKRHGD
jgi:hypothetical protein